MGVGGGRVWRGIDIIYCLFHHENIHCGYSLEVPLPGTSNEYHMFSWKNKKNVITFWLKKKTLKKVLYLELCINFVYTEVKA